MPTERFFKLKPEKRDKIKEAALKEFFSKSYRDMSINSIVKEADISRGSFYTYFEDSFDLVTYILWDIAADAGEMLIEQVKKCDGNLFFAIENMRRADKPIYMDTFISKLRELITDNEFTSRLLVLDKERSNLHQAFIEFSGRLYAVIDHKLINLDMEQFKSFFDLYISVILRRQMCENEECKMRDYIYKTTTDQISIIYRGVTGDFKTDITGLMQE